MTTTTSLAADKPATVPTEWADHALTYKLENELHHAVTKKSTQLLDKIAVRLESEQFEDKREMLGVIMRSSKEIRDEFFFKMSACHHAGLMVRILIANLQDDVADGKPFTLRSGPLESYAENMGRCERVFKKPATKRLL